MLNSTTMPLPSARHMELGSCSGTPKAVLISGRPAGLSSLPVLLSLSLSFSQHSKGSRGVIKAVSECGTTSGHSALGGILTRI